MSQFEKVIIDADVCLNLARYDRINALRCVLENIAREVYVHEYVLTEELVSSECARDIRQMIDQGKIQSLSPDKDLSKEQNENYHATCGLLADAMGCDLSGERSEHRGEVLSVAIAKTMSIPIFLSNESHLQREIDDCINTGIDNIRVFRMWDIVLWIRDNPECGLKRKDAKHIFLLSCYKSQVDMYKSMFDDKWPI